MTQQISFCSNTWPTISKLLFCTQRYERFHCITSPQCICLDCPPQQMDEPCTCYVNWHNLLIHHYPHPTRVHTCHRSEGVGEMGGPTCCIHISSMPPKFGHTRQSLRVPHTNRTIPRGAEQQLVLSGHAPLHTGHLHTNTVHTVSQWLMPHTLKWLDNLTQTKSSEGWWALIRIR